MFEIGNLLIGNRQNTYSITDRFTKVRVIRILEGGYDDLLVEALEGKHKGKLYPVKSMYFQRLCEHNDLE